MRWALLLVALAACGQVKDTVDGRGGDDDAADPCTVAACTCTTATEDTDCGAHQFCDTTGPGRSCGCVAGYADGPSGCVWTGAIQDPGFAAQAWTPSNGALLNPTATGGVDPGEVSYVASALCGLGSVSQTIEMPRFAKAEPLVLELSYKDQRDPNTGDTVTMGVSLAGGWTSLPYFNDALYHTSRICLGEGGYAPAASTGRGGSVTIALGPYTKASRCPSSSINFGIDHAQIVTANAGECGPMPGLGPNADAEGTSGWTFTTTGTSSGGFVTGIGAGGSKAARIVQGQRCDSAGLATTISVPVTQNPALDLFLGTSAGSHGRITIGGAASMRLPEGTTGTFHSCLPPSLRGQVTTLAVSFETGSGACTDPLGFTAWLDNVKVVEDPACATTDAITDPGFEQGGIAFGAYASAGYSGNDGTSTIRTGTLAHGGTHFLEIDSLARCSSEGISLFPTVPAPSGANGPALTFFANAPVTTNSSLTARGSTTVTVTEGPGYAAYTVCLDPLFVGRPYPVSIAMYGGTGSCSATGLTESAYIDDIAVTTSAMCPAM